MNRGELQSSLVQQMEGGSSWWSMNNLRLQPYEQNSPLLPTSSPSSSLSSSSSSSSSVLPQYLAAAHLLPTNSWHENPDLPESWSQLLLGGIMGDDERCNFSTPFQSKQMDYSVSNQLVYPSVSLHLGDMKHESSQFLSATSSRSCVTTSFNTNMLDFSCSKAEIGHHQQDQPSECNSTTNGAAFKKARVQTCPAQSNFKVRKEKLGDRITALHQIVSPFGKTDTASVLLETIGYIRFLQGQIEALSTPYLGGGSAGDIMQPFFNDASMKERGALDQDTKDEPKRDLRSRGLCIVPVSCTTPVGSDNGADYWAPTTGGGFR